VALAVTGLVASIVLNRPRTNVVVVGLRGEQVAVFGVMSYPKVVIILNQDRKYSPEGSVLKLSYLIIRDRLGADDYQAGIVVFNFWWNGFRLTEKFLINSFLNLSTWTNIAVAKKPDVSGGEGTVIRKDNLNRQPSFVQSWLPYSCGGSLKACINANKQEPRSIGQFYGFIRTIGSFLGGIPQQDIYSEQSKSNQCRGNFQACFKFIVFPFLLILGSLGICWGLGFWNGIYNYPNGRFGEYLATLSYFIGAIVWLVGFIGFLMEIA